MSAINNVLFIYFYVRSINFVVCTSASNFLEYIKILPVNKNILLVHLIHLRAAQKGRILDVVNQPSYRRKISRFSVRFLPQKQAKS